MFKIYLNRIFCAVSFSVAICLLAFSLLPSPAEAAGIIYVDKDATTGGNTGVDWSNAYTDLQMALGSATAGDEIWVASGVYTPGLNANDTFQLKDDVAVYGGFSATENLLVQRNWEANITVLSGDIEGNDIANANGVITSTNNISGTNSKHIITSGGVTLAAILDGFTITAGYADGSSGGGILNVAGSPMLKNLVFSANYANDLNVGGAAMYNVGIEHMFGNSPSNPRLSNVTFINNSGSYGGAVYNGSSSSFHMTSGKFFGNTATGSGGGIYQPSIFSSLALTDVMFVENLAVGVSFNSGGGGIYNNSGFFTLTNVGFRGNSGLQGGGLYNGDSSTGPKLSNVAFTGNLASGSDSKGGGMFNQFGAPNLVNVIFSGNHAAGANARGGGLFNDSSFAFPIINSIFWNNSDVSGVGTITATVYSSNEFGSKPTFSSSLIQGSGGSGNWDITLGTDGGNNLDIDPQFASPILPNNSPTSLGNFQLQKGSPAIDTGNTLSYTSMTSSTTDLAGNDRIQNTAIDMGAYEADPNAVQLYELAITKSGSGTGNLSSMPAKIDCGLTCTASFDSGTTVTLTAIADSGSIFTGWSGIDCSGTADCVVTIDAAKKVTATFDLNHYTLTTVITGTGSGTISKSPDSISYTHGTTVTLTAIADSGSIFTGWGGIDCSGTADCVVTIDAQKAITATFNKRDTFTVHLPIVTR